MSLSIRDYVLVTLSNRQLRQSTARSYIQTIEMLDLGDVPIDDVNLMLLHNALLKSRSINTRRRHTVALRSIFREYPWIKQLKIGRSVPRIYELPPEDTIRLALMLTPYELQGLSMMYAGLRIGEACALKPSSVRGNILRVYEQRYSSGELVQAKTSGEVVIPMWLAERIMHMDNRIISPGAVRESFRRNGLKVGIDLGPHMLRHWYGTQMVNHRINPEIARRQMRHSDLKTTLGYYAQIKQSDVTDVVTDLFEGGSNL